MPDRACSTCGAPVFFVENVATGKRLILDAEAIDDLTDLKPNDVGVLGEKGKVVTQAAIVDGIEPAEGTTFHRSHWATCPDAAEHAARRKSRRTV